MLVVSALAFAGCGGDDGGVQSCADAPPKSDAVDVGEPHDVVVRIEGGAPQPLDFAGSYWDVTGAVNTRGSISGEIVVTATLVDDDTITVGVRDGEETVVDGPVGCA